MQDHILTVGKIYKLRFYDEDDDADSPMFLDYMSKLSSKPFKLIGEGMIPWGNQCDIYKYYLFKNTDNDIVEVFWQDDTYHTLIFCHTMKVTHGYYSDYLEYGSAEFPEFCGNDDTCVNVDIVESQDEW